MKDLNIQTVHKPKLPVKILQFGGGNFLRAFVDWMIHKANEAGMMNHGVVVVQSISQGRAELLKKQDCMYHVYLEGIKDKQAVKEITLVKSLIDVVNPYQDYETYQALALHPDLEIIISNTTEAGIRYEEGDDLTATPPSSFPAKLTALLYQRFLHFQGAADKGLLIICCELIENNGSTLREYVLKHADYQKLGDGFIDWIKRCCHFYNTLVDRIVPGFPHENIAAIQEELGFNDNLVVKGEYFHLWAIGGDSVIETRFPLHKTGLNVLFMNDIKAFRDKKVRILNGAHTAMTPIGLQLDCATVKDAFDTPIIEKFIRQLIETEVIPTINEDPQKLQQFAEKILERFYNPFIRHYLKDISLNSLSKWEARNFPTLKDSVEKLNQSAPLTRFSLAALLVLYSGKSEVAFTPNDTPEFVEFIRSSFDPHNIRAWVSGIIRHPSIWTNELSAIADLEISVANDAALILNKGMAIALKTVLKL